jgi:hypothetical protein
MPLEVASTPRSHPGATVCEWRKPVYGPSALLSKVLSRLKTHDHSGGVGVVCSGVAASTAEGSSKYRMAKPLGYR